MGSTKDAGSNRADRMANQVTAAQKNYPNYGKPAHLSQPGGGFTQSQLAGNVTGGTGGSNLTFGGGQNVTRDYSKTDLGKAGIDPSMVGGYGITPGDQKFSAAELANIGANRDILAGKIPGQKFNAGQLEELSQYNRALGLNQTSGMGFGESFRHNLGGLEAQRDFAQLGNMAKGIGNLMPGRALMTGLLNKIPGVNLPTQLSMSPINYNITDQMQGSELANILSKQQQEMYSPDLMNRYLFGDETQETSAAPLTPVEAAPTEEGPTWQYSDRYSPIGDFDTGTIDLNNLYESDLMHGVPRMPWTQGIAEIGKGSTVDEMIKSGDPYAQWAIDKIKNANPDYSHEEAEKVAAQGLVQGAFPFMGVTMGGAWDSIDQLDQLEAASKLHYENIRRQEPWYNPEPMQYGDMNLFMGHHPETAEQLANYGVGDLDRKDALLQETNRLGLQHGEGFNDWMRNLDMSTNIIDPEYSGDPDYIGAPYADDFWGKRSTLGYYDPSTNNMIQQLTNDPSEMATTFLHEGMHQGIDPIAGKYPGEEAWIRAQLGQPSPAGLGYSDFEQRFDQPGSQAFSDQLGWGSTFNQFLNN